MDSQLQRQIVVAALALASCSSTPSWDRGPEFVLCNDNPANHYTIRINYQDLMGIYEDYGMRVRACGDVESGCINHPLLISTAPRLPSGSAPIVRWSVQDYRFTMQRDLGSVGQYSIVAEGRHSDGTPTGRRLYVYDAGNGLISYRAEGVTQVWTRCAGRLTFDDLRALRARLQ